MKTLGLLFSLAAASLCAQALAEPASVSALETLPLVETASVSTAAPAPEIVPVPLPMPSPAPPMPADVGELKAARAGVANEREAITRLQIFLDHQKFGPGKIDGRWGEFTANAIQRYEKAHGLAVTPDPKQIPWQQVGSNLPLELIDPIYTTYQIKPEDLKYVGSIPRSYAEQAKLKLMPYRSLLEFVAERYHSDPVLIQKLNTRQNLEFLKPGDVVWVPNVEPFLIETLKEIARLPKREDLLTRSIHVDTHVKMLELREGDRLLATFPITPGSERLPAPKGTWKILGIAQFPWFRHDESMLNHGVRSNKFYNIPPGPNSPVGVIWIGLNKSGVGIHGTNSPDTIGRSGSHGCIRVANWDVIRLKDMVSEGMTVVID